MHVMLSEGQLFDDTYQVIRLVGEGAMGAVYEATHARLAGRYAIKVLLPGLSANPATLALFDKEARVTSLLQHPNIVQVVDHNTTADGTEYLVMEYLAGESLAQRLRDKGPLALDVVVAVVEQIAAGLAAAHAHGIVHRDLKPDNVFLVPVEGREEESVKILDFGISKVKDPSWGPQDAEGTVLGTPEYMSPEQVEGRVSDADAATDQFALAVMAYEMLTGRNPFQGDTIAAVFARVAHGDPAPMEVGRDLDLVVRRGLAKSNRQRFPCVTDFSEALRAAATGRARASERSALVAYAAGEVANSESKGRSRRRSWGLALGAAVVVSISTSFVLGKTANRRWSPAVALAAALTPEASPRRAEPPAPKSAGLPVIEEIAATPETAEPAVPAVPAETAEPAVPTETAEPAVPATVPPVPPPARRADRAPSGPRDRRPGRSGWTVLSAPRHLRPPITSFPEDEDGTMPASEP
jgi:serine/threonine-protein kinase